MRGSPPGEPGGGITGVVPGSAGRITLSGVMLAGGRITPSVRSSRSLKVSPGRAEPVERGSWRGSAGVVLSAVGLLGAGVWPRALALLRQLATAAKARADFHRFKSQIIGVSPARGGQTCGNGFFGPSGRWSGPIEGVP